MTALSVNLNKVALLRNARTLDIPSVLRAAQVCIDAGAAGITVHPRPDERHIRRQDVLDLAPRLAVEFNIEGNPFPDFMALVRQVRPAQCTLVPDDPDQSTSDHGWDVPANASRLREIISELKSLGVRVSLFLDPDEGQVEAAADVGADRIELYTEPYAVAFAAGTPERALPMYQAAARRALALGLGINAGHDLNQLNLRTFLVSVPGVAEVSIGHALIADALFDGLAPTVRNYLACIPA